MNVISDSLTVCFPISGKFTYFSYIKVPLFPCLAIILVVILDLVTASATAGAYETPFSIVFPSFALVLGINAIFSKSAWEIVCLVSNLKVNNLDLKYIFQLNSQFLFTVISKSTCGHTILTMYYCGKVTVQELYCRLYVCRNSRLMIQEAQ